MNKGGATPISGWEFGGGRAIVVFSGNTAIPWLRFLRPGFRHCYAVAESQGQWFVYNPASHQTAVHALGKFPSGLLIEWLLAEGHTVVMCRIEKAAHRVAPVRPYTCVEALKRLLGVRAKWVFTPWQLYKYLINIKNMKKNYKNEKNP